MRITRKNTKNNHKYFCLNCKDTNWLIECNCGCNNVLFKRDKLLRIKRFLNKHQNKLHNNGMWKGGNWKPRKDKYNVIKNCFDHPNANKQGRILTHVYNFTVRNGMLFCCMLKQGIVHHKIPVSEGGSDDLENLEGMMRSNHNKIHHPKKDTTNQFCNICGGKTSIDNKNRERWYVIENGYICNKCYNKIHRKKLFNISSK